MTLRPYQQKAIDDCRSAYARGAKRVVLVVPTGAGKTVIACKVAESLISKGRRALFLAHRRELVDQAAAKMPIECGVVMAGRKLTDAPMQVASLQTIAAREAHPSTDFIFFDECHHAVAAEYRAILDAYPGVPVLGLTATPERGDGTALGDVFEVMVMGPTIGELIALGHLVPSVAVGPRAEAKDLARDPVEAWLEFAEDRSGFIFCQTVKQSEDVAGRLNRKGILAAHVDAGTNVQGRKWSTDSFRAGRIKVLSSVGIFTEGFDAPIASACMLARSCGHAGAYLQMVGRVLRPYPGKKDALIIDLKGVTHTHGLPDDERAYSLDGRAISKVERLERISQCLTCGAVFRPRADRKCARCGAEMPEVKSPEVSVREMTRLDGLKERAAVAMRPYADEGSKQRQLARLRGIARDKNYKPGWVEIHFERMFGHRP